MQDAKQTLNQSHDYYNVFKIKLVITQITKMDSKLSRPPLITSFSNDFKYNSDWYLPPPTLYNNIILHYDIAIFYNINHDRSNTFFNNQKYIGMCLSY